MDPQNQLSGLDPKLKEAYERVMGTTIPPAPPNPPAGGEGELASPPPTLQEPTSSLPTSQTEPLPPPANQPSEPASPPPVQEPVQEPTPSPVAPPQPPEPPPIPPVQPTVAQNEPTGFVANAPKKGKLGGLKISPPILMAVGVALLVLYVFFWIRVFNLSLF